MPEYMKKKQPVQPSQMKKAEAVDPRREMTNGIPNSVLTEVFAGRRKADSNMMGHRVNLAESINAKMQQSFGMDISGLRIYRSEAMKGTGMHGMAQGNTIVLGSDVNLNTTEGQAILAKMRAVAQPRTAAEEERDTELRHGIYRFRNSSYFVKMRGLPMRCELLALDYLVNRTPESADTAICEFLDSLKKVNFGRRYDMSRASGTMIMTGSIIYDWCYDRMTVDVRKQYIDEFLRNHQAA